MKRILLILLSLTLFLPTMAGQGVSIRKKDSSFSSDILCTVLDGKVYRGSSTSFDSNILLRIDKNVIYRGNSTYQSDILLNIKDKTVYKGRTN